MNFYRIISSVGLTIGCSFLAHDYFVGGLENLSGKGLIACMNILVVLIGTWNRAEQEQDLMDAIIDLENKCKEITEMDD